ncbi:MAG: 30S ribosomal protein S17 [Desulfobacterales bacterium CG23_combo_of_CG06-09_8_20_14_all_51_8]|nr:MAG: 30S ribosomal protein S17 [Desulfobacterales bacterium CG23_combo_of_CG06-09_8_20_14_all_51_8]
MNKNRGMKRQLVGTVLSNKMDKTVTVSVERTVIHPIYKKFIKRRAKFAAHDAQNACGIGDRVLITESRPISKLKRWRVSQIIEKAV